MLSTLSVAELVSTFVPISRFNRGEAKKIFDEVRETGFKIVLKNDVPECVLLAPERYDQIIEILENCELQALAEKRIAHEEPGKNLTQEEVMRKYGITQEDLNNTEVNIG